MSSEFVRRLDRTRFLERSRLKALTRQKVRKIPQRCTLTGGMVPDRSRALAETTSRTSRVGSPGPTTHQKWECGNLDGLESISSGPFLAVCTRKVTSETCARRNRQQAPQSPGTWFQLVSYGSPLPRILFGGSILSGTA